MINLSIIFMLILMILGTFKVTLLTEFTDLHQVIYLDNVLTLIIR